MYNRRVWLLFAIFFLPSVYTVRLLYFFIDLKKSVIMIIATRLKMNKMKIKKKKKKIAARDDSEVFMPLRPNVTDTFGSESI